jgi:hypothetical protein
MPQEKVGEQWVEELNCKLSLDEPALLGQERMHKTYDGDHNDVFEAIRL